MDITLVRAHHVQKDLNENRSLEIEV